MINLMPVKMTPEDMIFTCADDPDRTVDVRRCDRGTGFAIRISNGPGRVTHLHLLADTASRLTSVLISAQNYEEPL